MSAADAALDALSVIYPAFAFVILALGLAVLSTCCELIAATLGDVLEAKLYRLWGRIAP